MTPSDNSKARAGMIFGLLGVLSFSLTLPATRLAVASFDPIMVGLGRSIVAAFPAALLLFFTKQPLPARHQVGPLLLVVLGVIIGFPVCSAWAMQRVDASHGAVLIGILPLATAVAAFLRAGERPTTRFWISSIAGSLTVVGFSLSTGSGGLSPADLALIAAVMLAALGYAEGGRLARELGGWQVICWSLILAFPIILGPLLWLVARDGLDATPSAWAGFAYLSVFSALLGFFAWYHGLALGGVAKVGQIQLLQPFFTFCFAAIFLGEHLTAKPLLCAGIVATLIFFGRRKPGVTKQLKLAGTPVNAK